MQNDESKRQRNTYLEMWVILQSQNSKNPNSLIKNEWNVIQLTEVSLKVTPLSGTHLLKNPLNYN